MEVNLSENMGHDSNEDKGVRNLINSGSEIAGAAVGGALGFLAGGPVGAAALGAGGALASAAIKHVGQEVADRILGPREKARIGGVLAIASEEIRKKLESGETPRTDGFFETNTSERSSAEEILEGCLIKARDTFQEKKLKHIGLLYANLAFIEIAPEQAHQFIILADRLTYLQYKIMAVASGWGSGLNPENFIGLVTQPPLENILTSTFDLHKQNLLSFVDKKSQEHYAYFSPFEIRPALMMPSMMTGQILIELLGLKRIDQDELKEIKQAFAPWSPEFERFRRNTIEKQRAHPGKG